MPYDYGGIFNKIVQDTKRMEIDLTRQEVAAQFWSSLALPLSLSTNELYKCRFLKVFFEDEKELNVFDAKL